jgi:hypothetical protein
VPRKGYESLIALDPNAQKTREAFIAKAQIEHLMKWGPATRYYEILSAPRCLSNRQAFTRDWSGKAKKMLFVTSESRTGSETGGLPQVSLGWFSLFLLLKMMLYSNGAGKQRMPNERVIHATVRDDLKMKYGPPRTSGLDS